MDTALPTRAAAALSPGRPIRFKNGTDAFLNSFTLNRVALLHSLSTPLFSREPRLYGAIGWICVAFILVDEDPSALVRLYARKGTEAIVAEAMDWAEDLSLSLDDISTAAGEIISMWDEFIGLDPDDAPKKGVTTDAGEVSRPAMDSSPTSPATA